MEYSLIFGVIREEISERLSLGVIVWYKEETRILVCEKKVGLAKQLLSKAQGNFLEEVIRDLQVRGRKLTTDDVRYLSDYSNNLISFSSPTVIDLDDTEENLEWLFKNYVC